MPTEAETTIHEPLEQAGMGLPDGTNVERRGVA